MRVLIVDDDHSLAAAIQRGLSLEGLHADVVSDGISAIEAVAETSFDAVVLDRDLPGLHGDQVCRELMRCEERPSVLMLSAAGEVRDRVAGLELGADDYLVKPFAFPELVARLRSLGRRPRTALPPILKVEGLELDPSRQTVRREGSLIPLSRKEFAVLEVLMRNVDHVVSAEHLLEKAWDANANPFSNSIRVTVSTLRRKLGTPLVIQTVIGSGYRLSDPLSIQNIPRS